MIAPSAQPLLSVLEPAAALGTLEEALLAERKTAEAVVISELRSFAGDLDSARNAWLRSRRLSPPDPQSGVVDRPTLVTQVLPPTARHVLLEVAAAIAGAESKMLRSDLSEIGLSPRDRIAARTGHPTRALLDRVARELCAGDVELVATPNVTRVRVLTHDAPWVCVPSTFVDLPEPVQLVGLARAVARIAYGVPWLDELAPAHIEALLVAAARQVAPRYPGQDSKTIAHYEASLARALSRRQRKLLDDLIPHLTSPQSRPPGSAEFVEALTRGEVRAAFLVGGDVLSLVDSLAPGEPTLAEAIEVPGASALTAVLGHPLVGDAVRFALTPEATLLRRRLGSTWDALAVAKGKVANRHG